MFFGFSHFMMFVVHSTDYSPETPPSSQTQTNSNLRASTHHLPQANCSKPPVPLPYPRYDTDSLTHRSRSRSLPCTPDPAAAPRFRTLRHVRRHRRRICPASGRRESPLQAHHLDRSRLLRTRDCNDVYITRKFMRGRHHSEKL